MRTVAEAKTGTAIVIQPNGVEARLLTKPSLEMAQATIGGYIQIIKLADGRQMLVDEDGLPKHLPSNQKATALAAGAFMHPDLGIVGTVLILGGSFRWE